MQITLQEKRDDIVKKFDNELADLKSRMTEMGELTSRMFQLVCDALEDSGLDIQVEANDLEEALDQAQISIDSEVVRLMTVYSPVATISAT